MPARYAGVGRLEQVRLQHDQVDAAQPRAQLRVARRRHRPAIDRHARPSRAGERPAAAFTVPSRRSRVRASSAGSNQPVELGRHRLQAQRVRGRRTVASKNSSVPPRSTMRPTVVERTTSTRPPARAPGRAPAGPCSVGVDRGAAWGPGARARRPVAHRRVLQQPRQQAHATVAGAQHRQVRVVDRHARDPHARPSSVDSSGTTTTRRAASARAPASLPAAATLSRARSRRGPAGSHRADRRVRSERADDRRFDRACGHHVCAGPDREQARGGDGDDRGDAHGARSRGADGRSTRTSVATLGARTRAAGAARARRAHLTSALEAQPVRPRGFLAEAATLVGLVLR